MHGAGDNTVSSEMAIQQIVMIVTNILVKKLFSSGTGSKWTQTSETGYLKEVVQIDAMGRNRTR